MDIASRRILQVCGVVIVLGLAILAYDRWVVRSDEAAPEVRREQVAGELALEIVEDDRGLARAAVLLEPFGEIAHAVDGVEVAMRQVRSDLTLWLIEFTSRERTLIGRPGFQPRVTVPRLAIVAVFDQDPGWASHRQTAVDDAPPELPGDWHPRLAAMTDFRMGIEGPVVAFVSRIEGSALVQAVEARTSPEFHAGLLNSALRVDVQRALDIIGAMPGAPHIDRFYRIDVDVKLPAIDRSPLDRAAAQRNEAIDAMRSRMKEIDIGMEKEREALRERMAEQREEMRERMAQQREQMRERSAEMRRQLQESAEASRERLRESAEASRERLRESTEASLERLQESVEASNGRLQESVEASLERLGEPVSDPAAGRVPERAGAL